MAKPQISKRPFGAVGMPAGVKELGQRADFRTDSFIINIETHGYRLAWTRAALCPCVPINTQTQQSNPNCVRCRGTGFFYFGDTAKQDASLIGDLNEAQQALLDIQGAYVIRGVMTSLSTDTSPFDKIGGWRSGSANVTVRAENRLAYYDRLVALDSILAYHEVVTVGTTNVLPTRYVIDGGVSLAMDQTFKRYIPDQDFRVVRGQFTWLGAMPAVGTRVVVHYMTHPTWIITSYPHTVRNAYIAAKSPAPTTPEGDFYDLPVQAMARLEFLVHADEKVQGSLPP